MIKAIIQNVDTVEENTIANLEIFDIEKEKTIGSLKGNVQNFSAEPNNDSFRNGYKLNLEIVVDLVELR